MASFQEDPMPTDKEKESISPRIRFPLTHEWSSTDSVPTTKNEIFRRKTTPDYVSVWEYELSGLQNGLKSSRIVGSLGPRKSRRVFTPLAFKEKIHLLKLNRGLGSISHLLLCSTPLSHFNRRMKR